MDSETRAHAAPPPLPTQSIAYLNDAGESRDWAQLVRIVGVVAVVTGAASLGQFLMTLMASLGIRAPWAVNIRPLVPTGFGAVPAALLLAGGIGCVSLRP